MLGERELTKCLTEAVQCVEEEGRKMERCEDDHSLSELSLPACYLPFAATGTRCCLHARSTAAMTNFCQKMVSLCDDLNAVNAKESASQRGD